MPRLPGCLTTRRMVSDSRHCGIVAAGSASGGESDGDSRCGLEPPWLFPSSTVKVTHLVPERKKYLKKDFDRLDVQRFFLHAGCPFSGTTRGAVALFALPGRAFRVPLPPETQRTRGTDQSPRLAETKEEARARRRAVLFRRRATPSPPRRACHFSLGLLSHTYTQRRFSRQNCIYDRPNRDPPMLHKIFLLTNMY